MLYFRKGGGKQADPMTGREDCLYLNIYTPGEKKFDDLKPVMVWIHGGAFLGGSGNADFYGPEYFMDDGSVVLVTINYRLGPLGWLTLEDDVIGGNLGLKDQALALKWIQENIANFGGDKSQVTIFGESAGGVSVMQHVVSDWSKGLFHKAISQSGPGFDIPALYFERDPKYYGQKYVAEVGCDPEKSSEEILKCLQGISVDVLMDKGRMFEKLLFMPNPWKPVVDSYSKKPFVKDDPRHIMEKGQENQVPLIIGANQDEGCLYLIQFFLNKDKIDLIQLIPELYVPMFLYGTDSKGPELELSLAKEHFIYYVKDEMLKFENRQHIQDLLTDVVFAAPVDKEAQLLQENHKQSVYYYNYR